MRPPFIRHNHPQAASISQEARQTESIPAPRRDGRMKNVFEYMHQTRSGCHTEGRIVLNWSSLERSHCYTGAICKG